MLLKRGALLALLGASAGVQAPPPARDTLPVFRVEHSPPACLLAEKTPRLVACLQPRSQRAVLRVLFRAEGDGAWYASPLRSDLPCYSGLLPRPSRALGRVVYLIEAEGTEGRTRTPEIAVPVASDAAACAGRPAPIAVSGRATWEAPPGAPHTPPGFEGARPPAPQSTAASALAPSPASGATTKPASRAPSPGTPTTPPPPPRAQPPPTSSAPATPDGGGHGLRNTAIVVGTAAAGGAAVALTRKDEGGSGSAPTGSGLPPTGVSGVYVGTETINYPGGCVGTDDVVLNLQEAGGTLSGVLTFTVRDCTCCANGRGANPVSGALSGTSLQLTTPTGFTYSGSFAGARLSGSLAAPGGVTGTWTVDKR